MVRFIVFWLLTTLVAAVAWAQCPTTTPSPITFRQAESLGNNGWNSTTNNVSSYTRSYTVASGSNANRMLFLCIGAPTNDFSAVVNSVTYNGVPMTLGGPPFNSGGASLLQTLQYAWMMNPPSGAHDVTIAMTGPGWIYSQATEYDNVAAANPIDGTATNAAALQATATIPGTAGGDLVVACVTANNGFVSGSPLVVRVTNSLLDTNGGYVPGSSLSVGQRAGASQRIGAYFVAIKHN